MSELDGASSTIKPLTCNPVTISRYKLMRTLVVRPGCANKSAPISPEALSPRFLLTPKAPEFEPPDSSSPPPDDIFIWPEPSDTLVPPLVRKASRRALYAHRGRLRSCQR